MTSTKNSDANRLIALDGLRGWAAACVALMHFPLDDLTHTVPMIANSFLFVDLFFVLSGFVISYVYSKRFRVADFIRARCARLLPLYFATLLAGVLLELIKLSGLLGHEGGFKDPNSLAGLLHETFLVHVFWWLPNSSFNPPNWSVAVEMYAYLLFVLAAIFQRMIISAALMLLVSIPSTFAILDVGLLNDAHILAIPRGLLGFSVGVLVHALWVRLGARSDLPFLGDLALMGVVIYVWLGGSIIFQPAFVFGFMLIFLLIGVDKISFMRFIRSNFSLFLGKISYTLYMTHYFLAMRFEELAALLGSGPVAELIYLSLYCAIALVLSSIVFKYFEWPARQILRGKSR